MFVGDMNAHHEKWLGSSMITVLDFASSGCEQMVTVPTFIDGRVLDLVLTDAYDLVGIRVDSQFGPQIIVPCPFHKFGAGVTYSSLALEV